MKLQTRDKKLMEHLYRYGVLTTAQVRRLCFKNVAHTTVLRRLRLLESEDLILRLNGLEEGLLCWSLTNHGAQRVGLDRPSEYRNRNVLRHTTTLADVRMSLERVGLCENWIGEIELKRRMGDKKDSWGREKIIPDGLFSANVFGKTQMVALELEINLKSRGRYQELFRQYADKNSIGLIWYVVESLMLGQSLLRIWESVKRYPDSPRMKFSLLEDVLLNLRSAKMVGLEKIETIENIFGLSNESAHEGAQGLSMKTSDSLSMLNISNASIKSTA